MYNGMVLDTQLSSRVGFIKLKAKTFGKIETASAIFWDYLGMFEKYGQKKIFDRDFTSWS